MSRLKKYKRIFVFLLIYFLLTELFSSSEDDYLEEKTFHSYEQEDSEESISYSEDFSNNIYLRQHQILAELGFFNLNETKTPSNHINKPNNMLFSDDDGYEENKKRSPEKNNTKRKRKISTKETIEDEEEKKSEEEEKQIVLKKARKSVKWTNEVTEHLEKLKTEKTPDNKKKYKVKEIIPIMTEKFPSMRFTEKGINEKWRKTRKDKKVRNHLKWTKPMEKYLRELKKEKDLSNKNDYSWQDLARKMREKFPKREFTESIVRNKWRKLNK